MGNLAAIQKGAFYGASFLYSTTKAVGKTATNVAVGTARTGASVATGIAKAAIFVSIPRSPSLVLGVGAATWYAKQTAAAYAPQLLSSACLKAATYMTGSATVGGFLAKTVIIPAFVPAATPIFVGTVGVATYMTATTLVNTIHACTSKKENAAAPAREISLDDFVMVEAAAPAA